MTKKLKSIEDSPCYWSKPCGNSMKYHLSLRDEKIRVRKVKGFAHWHQDSKPHCENSQPSLTPKPPALSAAWSWHVFGMCKYITLSLDITRESEPLSSYGLWWHPGSCHRGLLSPPWTRCLALSLRPADRTVHTELWSLNTKCQVLGLSCPTAGQVTNSRIPHREDFLSFYCSPLPVLQFRHAFSRLKIATGHSHWN